MKEQLKISIIDTISYFDVFNYPPTLKEVVDFLHFNKASTKTVKECLDEIPFVENKYGYYFFSGKEKNAVRRRIQSKDNLKKTRQVENYIHLISKIPGVRMIGITGSVAMGNSSKKDDIDLLIITRKNALWITRFMVVLLAKTLGKKREYKADTTGEKLCLNMFMDEKDLEFLGKNIYTAHEISQMKVKYSKKDVVQKFNKDNNWINEFLPNLKLKKENAKNIHMQDKFGEKIIRLVNLVSFIVQFLYMRKRITNEKITLRRAFFHPNDNSKFILREYKKRMRMYYSLYGSSNSFNQIGLKKESNKKAKLYN